MKAQEELIVVKKSLVKVIRIQKKPYLGVLKNHKQFRVAEAKLSPSK